MTIWGKYKDKPIEKIDTCTKENMDYMLYNYKMAFSALPGQHEHKNWKIWVGKKSDCPKE